MSIPAMNWVWSLKLGDATRKLVLLKYADTVDAEGRNTWHKPKVLADFAECSERTVQRHTGWLLSEGFMREGDQSQYNPGKGRKVDPRYIPIVYDLAMCEEVRLQWKEEYARTGGKRAKFVAAGSVRHGEEAADDDSRGDSVTPLRGANVTPLRGDSVTPLQSDLFEEPQVRRGDNVTPLRGDSGPEVTTASGPEVSPVSPKKETHPVTPSSKPFADADASTDDAEDGPKPRKRKTRLPDDFVITQGMRAWAGQKAPGINVDDETEAFRDYHLAHGNVMDDWTRAWHTWMRNAVKFSARGGRGGSGGPKGYDDRATWGEAPAAPPPVVEQQTPEQARELFRRAAGTNG